MIGKQTSPQRRALLLAAAGTTLAIPAYAGARRIGFEETPVGSLPAGFTPGLTGGGISPRWVVMEDSSSPAGLRVLAETSRDRTDNRFPHVLVDDLRVRDVAVSVLFRPIDGRIDRAAGLIVRYRDAANYYVARANALEDNVRLYRVVGGRRIQFAGVTTAVPSQTWQTLGLRVEGDHFTVSMAGCDLFEATDRTFREAGQIGLWTKADSLTHFAALDFDVLGSGAERL
jgi:hypothetical protein